MDSSYGKLTVYFEDPFWVGVFERIEHGKRSVCKITFGAEPGCRAAGLPQPEAIGRRPLTKKAPLAGCFF